MAKAKEDLKSLRSKIDQIDQKLYALIQKRASHAVAIGNIKSKVSPSSSFYKPDRETKILRKDLLTNSSIVWSMSLPFLFYKKNIRSFDVLDKPLLKKINLNSPPFRSRNNKKKIGICWRGNPKNRRDNERSIDPNILKNILQNKDYDFFVFHKKINQIDTKIIQKHPNVFSLSDNLNDFYESSCYLNEMNMVITVDTSVLHLAGTLKKKTMALLPFVPDPRWKIEDGKFWYKTIEFIFQNNLNDWSYPLKKVQRVLEQKLI